MIKVDHIVTIALSVAMLCGCSKQDPFYSYSIDESIERGMFVDTLSLGTQNPNCNLNTSGHWIEYGHAPVRSFVFLRGWKRRNFYNVFINLPKSKQYPSYELGGKSRRMSYQESPSKRYYFQLDTVHTLNTVRITHDTCEFVLTLSAQ